MNWLWGTNNDIPEPTHDIRTKKKPTKRKHINNTLKSLVWTDNYGEQYKVKCYVCNSHEITPFHCHCGHIISLANGGTDKRNNLKPICDKCNLSMGSQNLDEFKESIKLEKKESIQ